MIILYNSSRRPSGYEKHEGNLIRAVRSNFHVNWIPIRREVVPDLVMICRRRGGGPRAELGETQHDISICDRPFVIQIVVWRIRDPYKYTVLSEYNLISKYTVTLEWFDVRFSHFFKVSTATVSAVIIGHCWKTGCFSGYLSIRRHFFYYFFQVKQCEINPCIRSYWSYWSYSQSLQAYASLSMIIGKNTKKPTSTMTGERNKGIKIGASK